MSIALKIEDVSKMYRLGTVGTGTLSHDINRYWAMLRGHSDPSLKIGMENNRAQSGGEYVWALRDINLEVRQGEILGIIGRNGAGKSTLLKLLSRVTAPTTGSIKARGRIASLLEVGTGFHPELTGRENVYLNGAIMGMTRPEITKRLEEIVEFSGCAKYIDTPVKRYSSGMTVRLGFAVAAHLECEILIVDEVLAVGDAEFQKKCIGKMQEVGASGRTILFVSHNMASVEALCERAVILDAGTIAEVGHVEKIVERYSSLNDTGVSNTRLKLDKDRSGEGKLRLRRAIVSCEPKTKSSSQVRESELKLSFLIENTTSSEIDNVSIGYSLSSVKHGNLLICYSDYEKQVISLQPGMTTVNVRSAPLSLTDGRFKIGFRMLCDGIEQDWPSYPIASFALESTMILSSLSPRHSGEGAIFVSNEWELETSYAP